MSFTSVQATGVSGSNSATFTTAPTAGNAVILRIVFAYTGSLSGGPTVGDNKGTNTYTLQQSELVTSGVSNLLVAIYTSVLVTGGSGFTVSYTPQSGSMDVTISIEEVSFTGTLVVDAIAADNGGSGTSLTSGSMSLIGTSDMVVGVGAALLTGQSWTAGGSSSPVYTEVGSAGVPSMCAVDQFGVSGSIAVTMTDTVSSAWACASIALSTGGGTDFPLTASPGSYSITGVNASLLHGALIFAAPASFGVTGTPASLYHDRQAHATPGEFTVTGHSASLIWGVDLPATPGSYGITGIAAGLEWGHEIVATPGAFTVTGIAASLMPSNLLDAAPAAYTIGRIAAVLTAQRGIFAAPGSYGIAGIAATLQQPATLTAEPAAYTITGIAANMSRQYSLFAGPGVYSITGITAVLTFEGTPGAVGYRIYSNGGSGVVDYSTIVATTSGLTYTTAPLTFPNTWIWAVRAFYENSGLEETNVDAVVTIVLDGMGQDITNTPPAPIGLRCFATQNGSVRAEWGEPPTSLAKQPTGFHIYTGTGTPNYSSPAATVLFNTSLAGSFVANLSGFSNGQIVAIAVRAYNSTSEEQNSVFVTTTAASVGPTAVVGLTGIAIS